MHKDCKKVRDLLPLYSVQGLDDRTARGLAAHLESCPGCHREWVLLQKTVALMDDLGERQPPGELWPGIAQHLDAARPRRVPVWERAFGFHFLRPIPALAWGLAVLIMMVAIVVVPPQFRPGRGNAPAAGTFVAQHTDLAEHDPLADRMVLGLVAAVAGAHGGR